MQFGNLERSLREHPFCREMTDPQVAFFAGCAQNRRVAAGDYLVREGNPAEELLLLRDGTAVIEIFDPVKGPLGLETLGSGNVIGWAALFPPHRWHLDVRAVETCLAFAFPARCILPKLEADPAFGYAVLKPLLFEVHQRLERVRLQQLDLYKKEPA